MLMQPAHVHPSEPIVAKNMDISSVHLRPLTGIQFAEIAVTARPGDGTIWHRSLRWEPTNSIQGLVFNQFRLNHIARVWQHVSAAFSACCCPLRLSVSGKPVTQRPPSESLLAARGIQACVTRRTRAVGRSPTVLLPPCFMTLHEQGFHSLPILAEVQCAITCPPRDIDCSVQVGMGLQTTGHTTKGLLIRTIGPVGIKIWHACDE